MAGLSFADADAVFSYGKYVILGIPLDVSGTHRRGTGETPKAIREESYNFESYVYDLDVDLKDVPVHDMGDLKIDSPRLDIFDAVAKILEAGKVPIIMGGEHSVTPFAVEAFPEASVLVFDAHLDYRDEYEGDKDSHACAIRRIDEAISPEKVLPVGVRSIAKDEFRDAKKKGLEYITADQVRKTGMRELVKFIDDMLPGNVYISIDMDAIDPAYAPGVATPEPYGLDPLLIRDVMRHLAPRMIGMDVVEVCPPYDNGNTASLAAKFIRDFIAAKEAAGK